MQQDYKVNKGLAESCKHDIKTYKCLKGDIPDTKIGKLSHVLLCLEGVQREGMLFYAFSPERKEYH